MKMAKETKIQENLVGLRIRRERERMSLTIDELAKRAGLSENAVQFIETGKRTPGAETIVKLAETLDVPSDYLLGLMDEEAVMASDSRVRMMFKGMKDLASEDINILWDVYRGLKAKKEKKS